MELNQAIKKIINDHGIDILKESRLVNMLSSAQASGQFPYAVNMLRQIYDNGYGTVIHKIYCNQDTVEVSVLMTELHDKFGFDIDLLGNVLCAFSLPVKNILDSNNQQNLHSENIIDGSEMEIIMFEGHRAYRDEFGGIYSYPSTTIIYKYENICPYYSIKEGTKIVANQAFRNSSMLEKIYIPNSIIEIGRYAFEGCHSLRKVTVPDSVSNIGDHVFYECYDLTEIVLPHSVTCIGDSAFSGCLSLKNVLIPNSVLSIGGYAFSNCQALQNIVIPNSVTSIGNCVFHSCYSLREIKIPDSVTNVGYGLFNKCGSLQRLEIPFNSCLIGNEGSLGCDTSIISYV
ncbi:MAG: leucine-rich repeat domain-containing protein [Bacteroidales bacterium]|nr:leucine-rich repeat domain-containing protein [Bacteroidales bacterium]